MITSFENLRVYLSGPMEFHREDCHVWRDKMTDKLIVAGFNRNNIIDPVARTPEKEWQDCSTARKHNCYDVLEKIAQKIIKTDLRYVDVTDFVIVHLFDGVRTCGTWDELFLARTQRKPVFVIHPGGVKNASVWLIGRVGANQIFSSMDEVIDRLNAIRVGKVNPPLGWRNIYE